MHLGSDLKSSGLCGALSNGWHWACLGYCNIMGGQVRILNTHACMCMCELVVTCCSVVLFCIGAVGDVDITSHHPDKDRLGSILARDWVWHWHHTKLKECYKLDYTGERNDHTCDFPVWAQHQSRHCAMLQLVSAAACCLHQSICQLEGMDLGCGVSVTQLLSERKGKEYPFNV